MSLQSPEFREQSRNIALQKFEQAGNALMEGRALESESILRSIPKDSRMQALGLALSCTDMMEEEEDLERFFISLKIASKLNSIMSESNPGRGVFNMWEASD